MPQTHCHYESKTTTTKHTKARTKNEIKTNKRVKSLNRIFTSAVITIYRDFVLAYIYILCPFSLHAFSIRLAVAMQRKTTRTNIMTGYKIKKPRDFWFLNHLDWLVTKIKTVVNFRNIFMLIIECKKKISLKIKIKATI